MIFSTQTQNKPNPKIKTRQYLGQIQPEPRARPLDPNIISIFLDFKIFFFLAILEIHYIESFSAVLCNDYIISQN